MRRRAAQVETTDLVPSAVPAPGAARVVVLLLVVVRGAAST